MHRDPKVRGEIVGHPHPRPPGDRPQGPCELQEPWPTLVAAYAADLPRLHVLHRRRQRLTPANTKYPRLAQGEVFGKDSRIGCQEIHHHDSEDQHEHRRELCAQARNMSSKLACSPSPVVTTFCSLFAWKVGKLICIRYRYGMSSTRMRCNSAKIVLRSPGSPEARALANSSSTCGFT